MQRGGETEIKGRRGVEMTGVGTGQGEKLIRRETEKMKGLDQEGEMMTGIEKEEIETTGVEREEEQKGVEIEEGERIGEMVLEEDKTALEDQVEMTPG